jgi:hypothetical protein
MLACEMLRINQMGIKKVDNIRYLFGGDNEKSAKICVDLQI